MFLADYIYRVTASNDAGSVSGPWGYGRTREGGTDALFQRFARRNIELKVYKYAQIYVLQLTIENILSVITSSGLVNMVHSFVVELIHHDRHFTNYFPNTNQYFNICLVKVVACNIIIRDKCRKNILLLIKNTVVYP